MRVIAGIAGGRKLETPEDMLVRPTTDKVKEALFSSIQFEIEGRAVLDLFSGSGQLGIEALSRGASSAVFVDSSEKSISLIKRNVERCSFKANIVKQDSLAYISTTSSVFDIAFLDPPYSVGLLQKALLLVSERMNKSGVIIAENPCNEELPEMVGDFKLVRQKKYGKLQLSFYRFKEE